MSSRDSAGACITREMGREKPTSRMHRPTEMRANTRAAPPSTGAMSWGRFSPRYRAMRTVMPMASWVTTKVTRFSTWLPVDTADRPEVEPNRPTTSRSTAP